MTPPIFARHLDVTVTCDGTDAVFTLTNTENKAAGPVTVKRSDGTEHQVATLDPFATLTERIEGPEAWVSVWAVFPTRVWHRKVSASCAPEPTTTVAPATTVTVSPTRVTVPHPPATHPRASTVQRTTPAELAHTGAGLEVTAATGAGLVVAGLVVLAALRRWVR